VANSFLRQHCYLIALSGMFVAQRRQLAVVTVTSRLHYPERVGFRNGGAGVVRESLKWGMERLVHVLFNAKQSSNAAHIAFTVSRFPPTLAARAAFRQATSSGESIRPRRRS
jgi:hypothetical protein